jgi:hypothetical protein
MNQIQLTVREVNGPKLSSLDELAAQVRPVYAMKNIAIVGLSKDPTKDSYEVGAYLKALGYNIIPINPTATEIMGLKSYPSLLELPEDVKRNLDVVDVFRRSEDVPGVADQVLRLHKEYGRPLVFWMQLGIENQDAARKLRETGIVVFQNRCMMATHRLLKSAGKL